MLMRFVPQVFAIALVAMTVVGCRALHTPANGQAVCGANASVRFSGYIPQANTDVQLQASTTGTGSWTTIGTAKSVTTGNTIEGVVYYRFSQAFQLTQWTSVAEGGAQLHTFVRARVWVPQSVATPNAHWASLTTFDVDLPRGTTPLACAAEYVQDEGMTAIEANSACASDDSPIAELFAPPLTTCGSCTQVVVHGDVTINSALTAAQYVCTQTIHGSLTVSQAAPEVVPLPALQTVTGNVSLDYSFPFQQAGTYYRRRFIQTPVLTSIGGNAVLYARRSSGPKAVMMDLNAVTSVGGDIDITLNDANPHVFSGLTAHAGDITIHGDSANSGELDVSGLNTFVNLTQVTGNVTVSDFFSALSFFNALEHIEGNLTIADLRLHTSFGALETVSGDLDLLAVKQIVSTWANQVSVAGELGILGHANQTGLTSFPVGPLQAHALRIENNASLNALTGASFQVGVGNIVIAGNPVLSQCQVDSFLAAQQTGGWSGTASVSGTQPCAR